MQLNPSRFFLTGIDTNSIAASGMTSGEYYLKDDKGVRFYFIASQVSKCTMLCRSTGVAQVSKVVFAQSALIDSCDDCSGHVAGIQIRIKRTTNPHFAHEDYLDSFSFKLWQVNIPPGDSWTATEIAADIVEQINTVDSYTQLHGYTAEVDGGDDTAILITSQDPDIEFEVFNVRGYPENTITTEVEAVNSTLNPTAVKQMFSLGVGFIPGRDVDESWQGCKNPCRLILEGCLPAPCGSSAPGSLDTSNAVHLHSVATPISFELWVDADDAGYDDFMTDLNAAITPDCTDVTPVVEEEG